MLRSLFFLHSFERRHHTRKKTHNLLSLDAQKSELLNLINISETGIQFHSREKIKKNKILRLVINLAEINSEISVIGRVVWCKRSPKLYRVGIHFLELNPSLTSVLRQYLSAVILT